MIKISHRARHWATVLSTTVLAACGGGGDDPPPERGTIVTAVLAGQATRAQIDAGTAASGLQALSGAAQCDVDIRYVIYITRDAAGQPQTASAGVLVPSGSGTSCSGNRPVVVYAHGTTLTKTKNMANVTGDSEASLTMAMFAAQGFIVVAPNYLGYDQSSLDHHPYLNADVQAGDVIDGLRAAKTHLNAASATKPSAQLLITGYSQGGHVAMATHKVIERDHSSEFTVTASGPMSGPYNLVGFGDVAVSPQGQVNAGATLFLPMLIRSYQRSYGDLYTSASEIYRAPYDTTAPTLFPTDTPISELLATNRLPANPAEGTNQTFTNLFGANGLLTDTFRAGYATSRYRAALQRNTLIDWTPRRPMALCGGAQDPVVFWALNTPVAQSQFASRGAQVPVFNLEDRASLPAGAVGDAIFGGFQGRKTAAGAAAVGQYHGGLVPPFCTAVVRGYFQQVLAAGL